jgi:hypothetical protein
MSISLTYKSSCLDKKRLIKRLLVGLIINPSKPNTPLAFHDEGWGWDEDDRVENGDAG